MHTLTPPFTLHCATQTLQILSRTLGFPDPIDVNSSLGLTFEIQIAQDNSHLLLSSRQLSIIVHNEYPILTMENFNHNESLVWLYCALGFPRDLWRGSPGMEFWPSTREVNWAVHPN